MESVKYFYTVHLLLSLTAMFLALLYVDNTHNSTGLFLKNSTLHCILVTALEKPDIVLCLPDEIVLRTTKIVLINTHCYSIEHIKHEVGKEDFYISRERGGLGYTH